MRPTISNSSTRRLISVSAWSPPKRIDVPATSRTDIDSFPPLGAVGEAEALALQPPADRCGDRPQTLGLEDQREHREHSGQRLDHEAGVVDDEADVERLGH